MPRGDRTGPMGSGPMTGRRMGFCAGSSDPGFFSSGPAFGMGRGRGLGRGFNRGFGPGRWSGIPPVGYGGYQITAEQEMNALAEQKKMLEDELEQLKQRHAELQKQKKTEG